MTRQHNEGYVDPTNTSNHPNTTYDKVIRSIREDGVCPFCPDNLHVIHPNPMIHTGDYWLTTDNAYPYKNADQHVLFIHKDHIETIDDLSPEGWIELYAAVRDVKTERDIKGGTLIMRFGKTALNGATVSHLHANLVSGSGDSSKPVMTRVG